MAAILKLQNYLPDNNPLEDFGGGEKILTLEEYILEKTQENHYSYLQEIEDKVNYILEGIRDFSDEDKRKVLELINFS